MYSTKEDEKQEAHFSVSTKMFFIIAIFSLPIGVLAYLLAANYTPQIETARVEQAGNALQKPLMAISYGLLTSQNVLQSCEAGKCAEELAKIGSLIDGQFQEALQEDTAHTAELKTSSEAMAKTNRQGLKLQTLQGEWEKLSADRKVESPVGQRESLIARYAALSDQVKQLIGYLGDTSTLILDPDLDSYYTVDVTLLAIPETTSRIAATSAIANRLLTHGPSEVDEAALKNESALLAQNLDRIAASNQTAFNADAASHGVSPTLQPNLRPALSQLQNTMKTYLASLNAVGARSPEVNAGTLASQAEAVQKETLAYWNVAETELNRLLNARVQDFETNRLQALGFSALAVVLAAMIAFAIGRTITTPLKKLVNNLGPGATLLGVSVERIAETSQSNTADPLEAAIICEELNAHADNMRKAVLELARHVQGSGAEKMAEANLAGSDK